VNRSEQKFQNAITVAVLVVFIAGLEIEYVEHSISKSTLVRLALAKLR